MMCVHVSFLKVFYSERFCVVSPRGLMVCGTFYSTLKTSMF